MCTSLSAVPRLCSKWHQLEVEEEVEEVEGEEVVETIRECWSWSPAVGSVLEERRATSSVRCSTRCTATTTSTTRGRPPPPSTASRTTSRPTGSRRPTSSTTYRCVTALCPLVISLSSTVLPPVWANLGADGRRWRQTQSRAPVQLRPGQSGEARRTGEKDRGQGGRSRDVCKMRQ